MHGSANYMMQEADHFRRQDQRPALVGTKQSWHAVVERLEARQRRGGEESNDGEITIVMVEARK